MLQQSNHWISDIHQSNQAISDYNFEYENSACKNLVIESFLNPSVAHAISNYLTTQALFEAKYGLYSKPKVRASKEEWITAEEEDRFFKFDEFVESPSNDAMPNLGLLKLVGLRNFITGADFKDYLQAITKQTYGGHVDFTIHRLNANDYLRPHDDRHNNRRLAYILYLSPNWKPEFGGGLNITSLDGKEFRMPVNFNQLTIFDVTQHKDHFIEAIKGEQPRISIGGWLREREES